MVQQYRPFTIQVYDKVDGNYLVTAMFGGASWHDSIPASLPLLTEAETQRALEWLERGFIDTDYAENFGKRLFQTLFTGSIKDGFRAVYERVAPENGLRVVLRLPPELSNMPWELLYDAVGGHGFLARDPTTPLVRHFSEMPLSHEPPKKGPLRILIAVASPPEYGSVSSEQEVSQIVQALSKHRLSLKETLYLVGRDAFRTPPWALLQRLRQRSYLDIDLLTHTTRSTLEKRLIDAKNAKRGYHVVHFIGHGVVREDDAYVVLEKVDEEHSQPGEPAYIKDETNALEFAELIDIDQSEVNLVVLNACQTAKPVNLFNSAAQALLRRRIPAVMGMQVRILDRTAVEFAKEFYGAWAAGQPIESALAYARRLISRETRSAAADWSIPILYMWDEGLHLRMEVPPLRWVQGVIGALVFLVFTLIPTASWYFDLLPKGPQVMDRVVNVAVIEFGEQAGKIRASRNGRWVSERLYDRLKPLEVKEDLRGLVSVQYINQPVEGDALAQEAAVRQLATDINATIVIYGTLYAEELPYQFEPKFYISEQFADAAELLGANAFGEPIRLKYPLEDDLNRLDFLDKIEPRLQALNPFLLGLAYFFVDKPEKAIVLLEDANAVKEWAPDQGKEILYLFLGWALSRRNRGGDFEQARKLYQEALDLTEERYARAYLGLGNLLYEKGTSGKVIDFQLLDDAIDEYKRALNAAEKPPTAHVDLKAHFNLGVAYNFKARYLSDSCPEPDAISALERAAAIYQSEQEIALVQEIGAKIYYQLGLLYEACGDQRKVAGMTAEASSLYATAATHYQQCILIATPQLVQAPGWFGLPIGAPPPMLREYRWHRLRWSAYHRLAYTYLTRAEIGPKELYTKAIDVYHQVVDHYEKGGDISNTLAAEAYYNLGLALTQQGKPIQAGEAYQHVLHIEPENSELYRLAEEALQKLK